MQRAYSTYFHTQDPQDTTHHIPKCPKCLHCLWAWPTMSNYWDTVLDYIQQVSNTHIEKEPYLCLFNILPANDQPDSERQRKGESQEWIQLSLLTARRCLTRHWIRATTPTIQEQQMDLQNLLRLERLDTDISGYKNTSVQNTLRKRWHCF